MIDVTDQVRSVEDYYAEAKPLTDRLRETHETMTAAYAAYSQALKAYGDWRKSHPVLAMVQEFDRLACYQEPPSDLLH